MQRLMHVPDTPIFAGPEMMAKSHLLIVGLVGEKKETWAGSHGIKAEED